MKQDPFPQRVWQTWARLRETRREYPLRCSRATTGPKVSVMVVTYNHARFIAQALNSILSQERTFEIEINVIDDASTDGTQQIARQYQERHPDIVRCLFNSENVGHIATQLNTYRGFQSLRGEYFALLEGDDYWCDNHKLARQVAFLDLNPDFVACAHNTLRIYDDGSRPPEHFLPFKEFGRNQAHFGDVAHLAAVYHLSSVLYRNVFGLVPPKCLADPFSCEATINMVYAQFGKFYHFDEYMSVYRVHGAGVFSRRNQEDIWLFHLAGYGRFTLYLGPQHWLTFARAISGFTSYVLTAYGRGVGPKLRLKARALFSTYFFFAAALYVFLRLLVFLPRTVRAAKQQLPLLINKRPSRISYELLRAIVPSRFVCTLGTLERHVPALMRFRMRWKVAAFRDAHINGEK
jgi:glycosyltransferase involved in cell wall biosynthesis